MRAATTTALTAMTPHHSKRWSEYARSGRVFCGPAPDGHHIPARFQIPESGFIECSSPAVPQELLDLVRFRASRRVDDAARIERELRRRGVQVPDETRLRQIVKDAPVCGRWVFLLVIRGGGSVVVEVSQDDRKAMEGLSTPAEMIEYLGIFEGR